MFVEAFLNIAQIGLYCFLFSLPFPSLIFIWLSLFFRFSRVFSFPFFLPPFFNSIHLFLSLCYVFPPTPNILFSLYIFSYALFFPHNSAEFKTSELTHFMLTLAICCRIIYYRCRTTIDKSSQTMDSFLHYQLQFCRCRRSEANNC